MLSCFTDVSNSLLFSNGVINVLGEYIFLVASKLLYNFWFKTWLCCCWLEAVVEFPSLWFIRAFSTALRLSSSDKKTLSLYLGSPISRSLVPDS